MDAPPFHLIGRPGKSRYVLISLCNLCVLCVSVVCFCSEFINHRDTEDTEVAQRRARSRLLCKAPHTRFASKVGNSVGDSQYHPVEVRGSNPHAPTKALNKLPHATPFPDLLPQNRRR